MDRVRLERILLAAELINKQKPENRIAQDLLWLANELRKAEYLLRFIVTDLPEKKDWLDPVIEKQARGFLKEG